MCIRDSINSGSELIKSSGLKTSFDSPFIDDFSRSLETSKTNMKKVVNRGIQLVDKDILEKIVLANRIKIKFKNKIDLEEILKRSNQIHVDTFGKGIVRIFCLEHLQKNYFLSLNLI